MLKNLKISAISALLCAASIFMTPFHLSAAYQNTTACCNNPCCSNPCEEECDPCARGGFLKRNGWLLLGAAALGAAAGAATGAAVSNHGRRGHVGPIGATGPAGPIGVTGATGATGPAGTFPTAAGSIDVTISIVLSLAILSGPIQPFVEAPDGTVFFGAPFGNDVINLGVLQSRTITIPDPAVIGTYHAGIDVPSSILASSLLVSGIAVPSRGGSTILAFPLAAIAIGLAAPGFQETADFTYGPGTAPIIPAP